MVTPPAARWRLPWVGPLVAAVHLVPQRAHLLGIWEDDALYDALAAALARGGPLVADCLPGAPGMVKYPLGFPALVALARAAGLDTAGLLAMQALCWGLAAQIVVSAVMPRLGAPPAARAAVGLLLAVNSATFTLVPNLLSEPAFTVALCAGAALVLDPAPTRARLVALAALAFAAGALRGAGGLLAVGGAAVALLAGRRALALALGVGWALAALLARAQRALTPPVDPELGALLRYHVGYDVHARWYADRLAEGGPPALLRAALDVVRTNADLGLVSLGQFFAPDVYVGSTTAGSADTARVLGAACLGLALLGAVRHARPLGVLVGLHAGIFLVWTWPFAGRFWLPVFPLLLALAARAAAAFPAWWARVVAGVGVGMLVLGNGLLPAYTAKGRLQGAARAGAPADAALDEGVAVLHKHTHPGDVLVGEFHVFWLARQAGLSAVAVRDLVPFDDALAVRMGWRKPAEDEVRLGAELAASLQRLRRATPPEHEVWVAVDPTRADADQRWVQGAVQAGVLEGRGRAGSVWLARVRPGS